MAGTGTGRAAAVCVTLSCVFSLGFFCTNRSVQVRDTCPLCVCARVLRLWLCARLDPSASPCAPGASEFACAGLRGCVATAAAAEGVAAPPSIWRRGRREACVPACVCSLGRGGRLAVHISVCVRASVCTPVCVCNQHLSAVCMRASVSPALISLCLGAISPQLAALKHQRETSASAGLCASVHIFVCVCARQA